MSATLPAQTYTRPHNYQSHPNVTTFYPAIIHLFLLCYVTYPIKLQGHKLIFLRCRIAIELIQSLQERWRLHPHHLSVQIVKKVLSSDQTLAPSPRRVLNGPLRLSKYVLPGK